MASTSNVASDDYYKVLGVDRQCDEAALKKAYRRAAVKWHPDKWSSKSQAEQKAAEENFKRVAEAYDALSDPQKRAAYDRYGKEGSRSVDQGGSGAPHVDADVARVGCWRHALGAEAPHRSDAKCLSVPGSDFV